MTTLALDLATQLGFAIARADGRIESGSRSFKQRPGAWPGSRWIDFRAWLVEQRRCFDITHITYEIVMGHVNGGSAAQHVYGGFVAHVEAFACHHGITLSSHHVGTIKKAWTGRGNATKPDMVKRCRELGFRPKDDNEADAIALLHVELKRVPPLPIGRQVKPKPLRKNRDTNTRELAVDPF